MRWHCYDVGNTGSAKIPDFPGILLIIAVFALPDKAAAMAQDGVTKPAEFIQGLADEAISVLSDQRGTIAEREQKFRTVLRDDFAMKKIGRFAIGKYWRSMSTEQKRPIPEIIRGMDPQNVFDPLWRLFRRKREGNPDIQGGSYGCLRAYADRQQQEAVAQGGLARASHRPKVQDH